MDLPVVDIGFKEIEENKAAGIYPEINIDETDFYTTGLIRTTQTLEAVYGHVYHVPIENMKEINFGDWEGKDYDALNCQDEWHEWMNDSTGTFSFPGGGESALSFSHRIEKGLDELLEYHHQKEIQQFEQGKDAVSVIFCHGGTIAATMSLWFPGEREYFFKWTPSTSRGYTVYFEDGKPTHYTEI